MAGSGVMTMPGIPTALFVAAIVVVLASSLLMPLLLRQRVFDDDPPTRDLLQNKLIKAAVRARPFQFILQLPFIAAFILVIAAGILGTSVSYMNVATILTWTIWWAGLILFVLFFGKAWCLVCPWNAIAQWIQRFSLWGRRESTTSMNFRWPKRLRNIYAATGLFVGLTWLELGFGVTTSPGATAALALLILLLAVVPAMYYERNSFCRYACLVGRVSGLYAMFSPTELRAKDREVCKRCRTKDCVKGNERGYGCPVFEYPGRMETNADCILCTECVKTCPNDNLSFNIRPFAKDIMQGKRLRADEAYLALVMLSLTAFHGITMTPAWGAINQNLRDTLGTGDVGAVLAFTFGMAAIIVAPFVVWYLGSLAARAVSDRENTLLKAVFTNYAFAIIPIALFYHLAHNMEHLLREGQRLVPVLSDPFGWGWDLFGTAQLKLGPLLSMELIQDLQVVLVLAGHLFAVYIAYRLFRWFLVTSPKALVPVVVILALFSVFNLWLLTQPMQMRTGL